MGENSKISWCDHTFNVAWGCTRVSPACDFCYAESLSKRYGFNVWGHDADRRTFGDKHWNEPLKWNRLAQSQLGRKARVFCSSMCDIFEDHPVISAQLPRLSALVKATPTLDWLMLTKRHLAIKASDLTDMPNVRMGVTVETQAYDFRIVPGVEWISAEPLLGPINFDKFLWEPISIDEIPGWALNDGCTTGVKRKHGLNHIIIGGESGHGARLMELEWAVDIIRQCKDAGVAAHFKQTGDVLARKLGLKDRSGKDSSEWPKELQVQEFPL